MCVTVVGLLEERHNLVKIHTLLRPLKVNKCHVYCVKKLFEETGDVCDCLHAGGPRSNSTKNVANVVHAQIAENPCHQQKIVSQEKNLVPKIMLVSSQKTRVFKFTKGTLYTFVILA